MGGAKRPEGFVTANSKHNKHRFTHLPLIRPCEGTCGRMTRPSNWRADRAPEAVARRNGTHCKACLKALLAEGVNPTVQTIEVRPETEDEKVLHTAKGLNRFMAGRQQRQMRSQALGKAGNVASPHQPQPAGNRGGRMAAAAHGPRPVPGNRQGDGTAGLRREGAAGGTDLLQRST